MLRALILCSVPFSIGVRQLFSDHLDNEANDTTTWSLFGPGTTSGQVETGIAGLESMNLKTALETYGHCVVKSIEIYWTTVLPNELMSAELLEFIKETLKARHGMSAPRHGLMRLFFMPFAGCEVDERNSYKFSIIVEHLANIEFHSTSAYTRRTHLVQQIQDGTAGMQLRYGPREDILLPIEAGSPLPKVSLFGIFKRLFEGESSIYPQGANPDHYDIFERNCFHFVEALVELTATPNRLREFKEEQQDSVNLWNALEIAQKLNKEAIGAELKRSLVGVVSKVSSSRQWTFDGIERQLVKRITG